MKYRKKPVVIEAYQTDKELDIETLEGTMHASVGDYIITGVHGEQYPCKPDIFEQTYEPADSPASPWHRVEEELPALKEVLPRYFVSGMCVLYNADTESFDTGFATKLDFGDAEIVWKALYVKNPTHWMPIEPPKEDA